MKLSIIVPVYNVEEYIAPCLESIFRQGLDEHDYEVIVVNDGTKDRSMEAIAPFLASHANITVVEQANQGLSAARNTGLSNAGGEYILFLDSDDMLLDSSLPYVLNTAMDTYADMAVADFVKMDDAKLRAKCAENGGIGIVTESSAANSQDNGQKTISGHDIFLHDFNPRECFVWRSLYRRRFLSDNGIRFIPGIYFEDVPFTTECYLRAGRCVRIRHTFYVYRQRSGSIVSAVSMKKLTDFNTIVARLIKMKGDLCTTPELRRRMDDTTFATFSIAVWYLLNDAALFAQRRTFINDLRSKAGVLRFSNGMKQRIVSSLFNIMPGIYLSVRRCLSAVG